MDSSAVITTTNMSEEAEETKLLKFRENSTLKKYLCYKTGIYKDEYTFKEVQQILNMEIL